MILDARRKRHIGRDLRLDGFFVGFHAQARGEVVHVKGHAPDFTRNTEEHGRFRGRSEPHIIFRDSVGDFACLLPAHALARALVEVAEGDEGDGGGGGYPVALRSSEGPGEEEAEADGGDVGGTRA